MAWISRLKSCSAGMRPVIGTVAILIYMGGILLILMPNSPLRDRILAPVYRYFLALGLTQSYAVFTPYVATTNVILTATVTLKDGTTAVWVFPRMERLALAARGAKERYRKWWHDNLLQDPCSAIRPDAARFVARQFADPANPPVLVSLQSHSRPIPPPPGVEFDQKNMPQPEQKTFFVYKVVAEDLK